MGFHLGRALKGLVKGIGEVVKDVAPVAGGLLLGGNSSVLPLITKVLGLEGKTPAEVLMTMQGNPDLILKLKTFDQEHELELLRLQVEDMKSARQMGTELAKSDSFLNRNITPGLALLSVLGFFIILGCMAMYPNEDIYKSQSFNMLLGFLGGNTTAIFSYYFGSSTGSKDKDDQIKNLSN